MNENPTVPNTVEEWKPVPEDPNCLISSFGRVKRRGKIKHLSMDKDGYRRLSIKGKTVRLHRLVAMLFVPNPDPENYDCVDHIDNNHQNNRCDNLRWCTRMQNTAWAAEMGLNIRGSRKGTAIISIDENKNAEIYSTVTDAAKGLGIDKYMIYKCLSGKQVSAKKHYFYRVNNLEDKRR